MAVTLLLGYLFAYVPYQIFEEFGNKFTDYTNRQYLASLQDHLKRLRLLYETQKISEEEYKKREGQVMRIIKSLEAQLRERPAVLDIRL